MGPEPKKATAPDLSGWGTAEWAMSMMENPDAPNRFGQTAYKGEMPSFVHPPADPKAAKTFKPMPEANRRLIAAFLAGEAAEIKDSGHDAQGASSLQKCATQCHLFRGETDDSDGKGPELAGWGSLAWVRAQITNPGTNTTYRAASMEADMKGHMPRFDDKLDTEDINLLAAWVRTKARGGK
jgi:ubiquinol-cytochrome c reductase cytochrome b subunit